MFNPFRRDCLRAFSVGLPAVLMPRLAFSGPSTRERDLHAQGEYVGDLILDGQPTGGAGLQVVALGEGRFKALLYMGPLPGADRPNPACEQAEGAWTTDGRLLFEHPDGRAEIRDGLATVWANGKTLGRMKRVERRSPTLGAPPPSGARHLFDGKSDGEWIGTSIHPVRDGDLLTPGVRTRRAYGDMRLHLEFQLPFIPGPKRPRADTGLLLQDQYEVQIRDSFGDEVDEMSAGAIVGLQRPRGNLCYPPMSWQTCDIDYRAPNTAPGKVRPARLTVRLNGAIVQDDVELKPAAAKSATGNKGPAPLRLLSTGARVRFRNIWLL